MEGSPVEFLNVLPKRRLEFEPGVHGCDWSSHFGDSPTQHHRLPRCHQRTGGYRRLLNVPGDETGTAKRGCRGWPHPDGQGKWRVQGKRLQSRKALCIEDRLRVDLKDGQLLADFGGSLNRVRHELQGACVERTTYVDDLDAIATVRRARGSRDEQKENSRPHSSHGPGG